MVRFALRRLIHYLSMQGSEEPPRPEAKELRA